MRSFDPSTQTPEKRSGDVLIPDGAKERTRARKAMPPRVESASYGCVLALIVSIVASLVLYRATSWRIWIALAAVGSAGVLGSAIRRLRDVLVLVESRALQARGVRCLVVYSDSPAWHQHIHDDWLPRLGSQAVTLNWSARATWRRSLEVRLFRRFIDARTNYNPAVLVFRGLHRPAVFRFYYAFQQAKHGRTQYLDALEAELFRELGVDTPRP